jgi:hypothetical protein
MDQAKIVIRDIHRYGDDLTVPEAIARLCGGGPVTVTVTGPRPARQRPARRVRHHHQSRRRHLPAGTAAANRLGRHRLPAPPGAALFAEALALASQLAGCTELGGGQGALSRAAAIGAAHGRDAARRALARATPAACRDITARLEAGDPGVYDLFGTPALSGQHGICYDTLDLADDLGLNPADDRLLTAAEEAYFTAAGEAFWAEAERIARDRAAKHPEASSPRSEA